MFSVITNIYKKKTKGPILMELFTVTGKLKKKSFFWQLEIFDMCTTGDTAHIDTIFNIKSSEFDKSVIRYISMLIWAHLKYISVNIYQT
jgi:hypothetical protein